MTIEEKKPLKGLSSEEYEQFMKQKPPFKCDRCFLWDPAIRKIDKEARTVEFICQLCYHADPELDGKYIKPKPEEKSFFKKFGFWQ